MNRYYYFILLSAIALSLTACVDNEKRYKGYLCKYLLIDLGALDCDYLIEVTDSGVMTISSGELRHDFYTKILYEDEKMTESLYTYPYLETINSKDTVKLTQAELVRLKKSISKITDVKLINPFIQSGWKDTFANMVIINGNKSVFVYIPSEEFSEFLTTIMELTRKEWKDHYGIRLSFDYNEKWVHECQRKKRIRCVSCWERIKERFD
ncbi:MAG: hypothetical protein NC344_09580 [Bacteroidales bacterium]|nr:hypothetical protein [Bacteroidales bacterium]MCM1148056.1 hypothetical protein [Bacteroidales bacterium]MCM1207247.1 hypothetical protein [Bacillota bacterium]MCM1509490.1 hypothetical protein [Clostridium sp.]